MKSYKLLLLILLISVIAYFRWFPMSIFINADWNFDHAETLRGQTFGPIWLGNINLGLVDTGFWKLPVDYVYGLFGSLGFNSVLPDKLFIFFPIIFLLPLVGFFLVRHITKSNVGGLIGSLVLGFNTYFLAINTVGHEYLTVSATFCLLAFYFFIRSLEAKRMYFAIAAGMILFIADAYDFRMVYIISWIMLFYFLCFGSVKKLILFITPFIILGLTSLYWVLPSFFSGSLEISGNKFLTRDLFGNGFWDIFHAFTLMHPFWNGQAPIWFVVNPIPLHFWLIPILAFSGAFLGRKNPKVIFFMMISLLGVFLTKQSEEPLKGIYTWLFDNVFGFKAFREATKFYFLIAFGYSVLIGTFVAWFWQKAGKTLHLRVARLLLATVISGLFLWNVKPMLTGEIQTMFIEKNMSQDYFIYKDFILNQKDYSRELWVPVPRFWSVNTFNHPMMSYAELYGLSWKELDPGKTGQTNAQILMLPFQDQHFDNIIDRSSIKYVLVPPKDIFEGDDFYINYGGNRQFYINKLDKTSFLKKIDIGTKELAVYENEGFRPHIYLTGEIETIQKDVPYTNVDFKFVNPTEYKISLKNLTGPVYLNFSEAFNANWKIRVGNFNWFDVLTKKNYFLADSLHSKNDASLNSFLVNPNGQKNLELTLYFQPQSYFYLGLIVSGTTLFLCVGYLIISVVKKHARHSNQQD